MGSKSIQGQLWGQRPKDWATIQEQTSDAAYHCVIEILQLNYRHKLLDIGCGSGLFSCLASLKGANVTGIDASKQLLKEAIKRTKSVKFLIGEMEQLPFPDKTFDFVCGFNSFQYATNTRNALMEAKRVLKDKGQLITMIWGNKEDCESATYLNAVGGLMPAQILGTSGPFALSENQLLEKILQEIDLKTLDNRYIDAPWNYANTDIALRGLLSAGPAAKAIGQHGYEKVFDTLLIAIQPYIKNNGSVGYKNKIKIVFSAKNI